VLASLVSKNANHVLQATSVVQVGQTVSKPLHEQAGGVGAGISGGASAPARFLERVDLGGIVSEWIRSTAQ
jgi:hypothetical protein